MLLRKDRAGMLWIGKPDYLIPQGRNVASDETTTAALNSAIKLHPEVVVPSQKHSRRFD
jgi:hypothetical protein